MEKINKKYVKQYKKQPIPKKDDRSNTSNYSFNFLPFSAAVDGKCSTLKPIKSGVLQGSIFSLTLFLLFINDLSSTES